MTDAHADQDEPVDQDSEPTMTAPPGLRPDAGASAAGDTGGRGDNPDVVDTDESDDADRVGGRS